MRIRTLAIGMILFGCVVVARSATAQISADPHGFVVAGEQGDTLTDQLTISNPGDAEIAFKIRLDNPDRRERRDARGPERDEPGDILERYRIRYTNNIGLAWDPDREWMWGVNHQDPPRLVAFNPETGELEVDVEVPDVSGGMFYLDGVLYLDGRNANRNEIYRYSAEGERLDSWQTPFDLFETAFDCDGERFFLQHWQGGPIIVYSLANWDEIGSINYEAVIGDATMYTMAWVPIHPRGQLWLYGGGVLHQLYVDDEWNCEDVQTIQTVDGQWAGLEHDGHDLWLGLWRGDGTWYKIDDGVTEAYWLQIEPMEGSIQGGGSVDCHVMFLPGTIEAGTYEFLLGVTQGDDRNPTIQMSCVLTVNDPVADIAGVVSDAATGEPIESVSVSIDRYRYSRTSDINGRYALQNLPPAVYQVSFRAPDFLPQTHQVELGEDGAVLNLGLLHSECNLSVEEVVTQLAPDSETDVGFSISNDGNGPLTYTSERRLLGDANAAPWDVRRTMNIGATLRDDRVEGVAFDGENFYFSGAAGADSSKIYVVNRDGDLVRSFDQLTHTRYGMKDIEFDGENLWGSGEQNVYGFNTDGEEVANWRGPFNPTNNIAFDSDADILWLSGTTSNIAGYDRQGNALNRVLNRKGLRIYGLAYWPDDPDGYNLYIIDQPADGGMFVHKMNIANGDTLLAYRFPDDANTLPAGKFICNTYDVYSWVLMSMQNIAPANGGDRLSIMQLDARKDWFSCEPTEGVIEAGSGQDFSLHLNANGLPPVLFEGEIVFKHDGVGSETHLPVSLDVVEGPVHAVRDIPLEMGWNVISSNIVPDDRSMRRILQPLIDARLLIMFKDDRGHFLSRLHLNFDFMETWEVEEGYMIKVARDSVLRFEGTTVMADDPIQLEPGWQIVSYYPHRPVNVAVALSGIEERLIVAKDGFGNFYLPAYNFENIGAMQEGQGYQLRVSEAVDLVYRLQGQDRDAASYASVRDYPGRYIVHPATGSNMSLLVEAPGVEGEIGVYAASELVGIGLLDRGHAGVAVWGDDPSTESRDGALDGEALDIRLLDDRGERQLMTTVVTGALTYSADGLAVVRAEETGAPVNFGLTGVYPNPFNGVTRITFGLQEALLGSIRVYDVSGRKVATVVEGRLEAGVRSMFWNAEGFSSGIYLVKLETPSFSATKKVMLIK